MNPITKDAQGCSRWVGAPGDKYLVTGTDTAGKPFRLLYRSWYMAGHINLHQGAVWLIRNGNRWLIKKV